MPTIKEQCESRIRDLVPSVIHYPNPIGDNVYATGGSYTIINLQDVLLAIEKVKRGEVGILSSGLLLEQDNDEGGYWGTEIKYDLSKSFSEQEQSLYSFLLEIIK